MKTRKSKITYMADIILRFDSTVLRVLKYYLNLFNHNIFPLRKIVVAGPKLSKFLIMSIDYFGFTLVTLTT